MISETIRVDLRHRLLYMYATYMYPNRFFVLIFWQGVRMKSTGGRRGGASRSMMML